MNKLSILFVSAMAAVFAGEQIDASTESAGEVSGRSPSQLRGETAPRVGGTGGVSENELTVQAEIMAIGDELCYGKVYDTNSFWIADQVTRRGVFVRRIVCVRDNVADISAALKDALSRKPRFLFITGGLGHTEDDLTRAALSATTGRKIVAARTSSSTSRKKGVFR